MKRSIFQNIRNQEGSALVIGILILMVVTVIGLLASRSALIEQQIATNDKTYKMTWFATDAMTDGLMPELLEQNIAERGFGSQTPPISYGSNQGNNVDVYNSEFYLNETPSCPSETNRDVEVPGLNQTDVYVSVYNDVNLLPGNAIQLPEGYHGRGKGMAGGGVALIFTIQGLGKGAANSEARTTSGWLHVI